MREWQLGASPKWGNGPFRKKPTVLWGVPACRILRDFGHIILNYISLETVAFRIVGYVSTQRQLSGSKTLSRGTLHHTTRRVATVPGESVSSKLLMRVWYGKMGDTNGLYGYVMIFFWQIYTSVYIYIHIYIIQFSILYSSMMYICVILVNYVNFIGITSTVWVCQCCASQWYGSRGRSASLESCNLHEGTSIGTCQALVFLLGIGSHKSDTIATPKIKQMSHKCHNG